MSTTSNTTTPPKRADKYRDDQLSGKTPGQTAKPLGSSNTPAAKTSPQATKKMGNVSTESVNGVARDDPAKAVEKLEIRLQAINTNNVARVANSHLANADDKLHPLVGLKTGKAIDKFPATSKDIPKLGLGHLDAILHALDADRTGSEETRREMLRLQLGLKPTPA
ncbi:hypothetical protein EJ03DRAFT_329823 [Teratosphaeria nubilosa]|uniref:Uncharacterized protein n=1 Tax=Teratosphaeria nubilosa TaxID=161662 RepID=A0A6G1L1B1_9PEZI|nr:hypothetical protein EJ03DRAFT_329823 [Teratosphaeria nubilosa]